MNRVFIWRAHLLRSTVVCLLLINAIAGSIAQAATDDLYDRTWRDLRFGLFIHWGLYSMLAGEWDGQPVTVGYSEQIQAWAKIPQEQYAQLAKQFNPTRFDPDAIVDLARNAGMRYIVLTSKHHDGFSMFHTAQSKYNVVDATPYGKDVLLELATACRRKGMKLGVYYSLIDWAEGHDPQPDHNSNPIGSHIEQLSVKQLEELMSNYGEIVELWFDMGSPTPEQSKLYADTVHRLQPACRVSGRVWNNQGDFIVMGDNRIPDYKIADPWQTPASIYRETWGYRRWKKRDDLDGKIRELTRNLVSVVSRGGVYLLNIGPRGDGSIVAFEVDVLNGIGQWVKRHRTAVFDTRPNPFDHLDWGEATTSDSTLYCFIYDWPENDRLRVPGLLNRATGIRLLSNPAERLDPPRRDGHDLIIDLAGLSPDPILTVIAIDYQDELRIRPQRIVYPGENDIVMIGAEDCIHSHSRAGGNYFQQKTSTTRETAYLEVVRSGAYRVQIEGEITSPTARMTIEIDDQHVVFRLPTEMGTADFRLEPSVTFHLQAGQLHKLTLRRDQPDYPQQDIGIQLKTVTLVPLDHSGQ